MLKYLITGAVMVCLGAVPASSGAWLREQGKVFLSFSSTTRSTLDFLTLTNEASLYLEYGLSPKMTVGVDGNWAGDDGSQLLVFARRALGDPDRQTRMAYELGVGARLADDMTQPLIKGGLSLGRGFESRWGNGWMALDMGLEFNTGTDETLTKLDSTVGVSLRPKLKAMVQLNAALPSGSDTIITLTPSVIWQAKPKRSMVLGLEARRADVTTLGVKFGIWQDF